MEGPGVPDRTHINELNQIDLCIPCHMQKTNFITQLILEIKLTHYSPSLLGCPGLSDHTQLKQPTNTCCFHGPIVTSKSLILYFKLFLRYCILKNPSFDQPWGSCAINSWTWFSPKMFLQDLKRLLTLSCWSKNAYISEWVRL